MPCVLSYFLNEDARVTYTWPLQHLANIKVRQCLFSWFLTMLWKGIHILWQIHNPGVYLIMHSTLKDRGRVRNIRLIIGYVNPWGGTTCHKVQMVVTVDQQRNSCEKTGESVINFDVYSSTSIQQMHKKNRRNPQVSQWVKSNPEWMVWGASMMIPSKSCLLGTILRSRLQIWLQWKWNKVN